MKNFSVATKQRAGGDVDNLFASDGPSRGFAEMLPDQFWSGRQSDWKGEHWLMFRVLEDAINCYLRGRNSGITKRASLAREAYGWIAAEDYAWPFSFVNICHTLDVDPEYLRRGILQTHIKRFLSNYNIGKRSQS